MNQNRAKRVRKGDQNGAQREPKRARDLHMEPLRKSIDFDAKTDERVYMIWAPFWLHFGQKSIKNDVQKTVKKLM